MARATISRTLAAAALLGAAFTATAVGAVRGDSLQIETGQVARMDLPGRGMTMNSVQSRFGAPSAKLAAVGKPPITRWEYPDYIVYFEYQNVIHSVPKHAVP